MPSAATCYGIISDIRRSATKFRRFRNQNQIRFHNPKKGASATKNRRFRNKKETIPQPKKDDSATKKGRFRNQNPCDSETKIRVTLQPKSVLLHSARHRLQVRGGGVGENKTVLTAAFLLLAHVQPHSTWHRFRFGGGWGGVGWGGGGE